MSKYAVIRLKGSQYLVEEGDQVLVDKITGKEVVLETLLLVDEERVKVGKPKLRNAKVKVKVVKVEEKGKKLKILKYKAKSRYRRQYGFRPLHTRILIESIS